MDKQDKELISEQERAIEDANCIEYSDMYFGARSPLMDTSANRNIYEACFKAAYRAASPQLPVAQMGGDVAPMLDEMTANAKQHLGGEFKTGFLAAINDLRSRIASHPSNAVQDAPEENTMCPNCVTPWKCNGPHFAVPQVVQAPIGIVRMHNKGGSGEFTSVEWVAGHAPQQDTALYAAPIVATVPSEQMEAEMWNRALEAAAIICDTSSLQPAIATRIRALKHATPSPTEQASNVRKPLLTECPECNGKGGHIVAEYCDNGIVQEGELCQMCKGLCIVPTHELSAHTTASNAGEAAQGEKK